MANRDLLKEAIADAKAVKEVAIANAKAALEEAFTPHLKDMLSEKIKEMDEEKDLAEVDKEKMEEKKELEKEGKEKVDEAEDMDEGYDVDEAYDMDEGEDMDEELDLEEILAELELEEGEDMDEAQDVDETKDIDEEKDMDEGDTMYEAEEEVNLDDMSEEELKGFIEDVIEDMIEDGELVPGPNADESEEEEGEDTDDDMTGDADVDIEVDDIDLQESEEVEEEILNEDFTTETLMQLAEILGLGLPAVKAMVMAAGVTSMAGLAALLTKLEGVFPKAAAKLQNLASNLSAGIKGGTTSNEGLETSDVKEVTSNDKELKEAKAVIKHLQSELNEVNLLNSKLLYTNKIFKAKNLTENQKIKVLKAFDKAESVKEAKVIYESLSENLVDKSTKSNIRESMGMASKPAGVAPKRTITEQKVVEEDAMVSRFKKLAGIK